MDNPEKNKLEQELIREKNQLRTIIDASLTSIWYKDTLNNFIRVNKAAAIIAGREVEEVEGKSTDEIFPTRIGTVLQRRFGSNSFRQTQNQHY